MSAADGISFPNIAATTEPFTLKGGRYSMTCHAAAWNSGSVTLEALAGDGSTWLVPPVLAANPALVSGAFAADGAALFDLSPGQYRIAIASATGVYIGIGSNPT